MVHPHGCGGCGQIIYVSPSPYTAVTTYTRYQDNPYANQTYDTEWPPYYAYPDYAPSHALGVYGYDGPRKAKSRIHRHALERNAGSYNQQTIRHITHGVKLARRGLLPLGNVKAFSAKASALTRIPKATSHGQLPNSALIETPMPKVVEVADQQVDIVSADAVNAIDLVADAPKVLSFADFKRVKSEQLDSKRVDAHLTNVKQPDTASDTAVAAALEQSARAASTNPTSLAEALAAFGGALAAVLTAFLIRSTAARMPGFTPLANRPRDMEPNRSKGGSA
jgi:hypothetical protein